MRLILRMFIINDQGDTEYGIRSIVDIALHGKQGVKSVRDWIYASANSKVGIERKFKNEWCNKGGHKYHRKSGRGRKSNEIIALTQEQKSDDKKIDDLWSQNVFSAPKSKSFTSGEVKINCGDDQFSVILLCFV